MVDYDDGDRLTLGELSAWSENSVAEIQELERLGVIERDAGGLFVLPETIVRMANYREAELADFQARYIPTWSYVFRRVFGDLYRWAAEWADLGLKLGLREVLRRVVWLKRRGWWLW